MGRKIDLSGLTDNEAEHVLQVVQRDMRLRKKEEQRLSELKQELDEEGSRCLLLSRQSCFNRRCCIRCCSPFTFLLNPKRQCRDCHYNVCKACRVYCKRDKAWLCSACQKSRFLKTQSLEWFYTNVKKRFKRFGSAKVLKTLYRKHLVEHSALSELTEGSAYEESICNEGSVCGSDSAFYRQTEEHSMAETLTVAMRVAEEAIDEAISKAEFDTSSQEKQNEAHYLREHRAELIEELAKTIVQKIISRRKTLAEMKADYDQECPLEHNADLHLPHHQATSDHLKHQQGLWRSHSAFSLLDNDPPDLTEDSAHALKKEGGGSAMSAWRSVDRLDSAVLKSPDGNWIALQSTQLSRPSLLTRRKSLVYSALEKESAVKSAYEGMGSDNETKAEPDSSWGAALQEIHRKMMDSNFNPQDSPDRTPSPLSTRRGSREDLCSDSEGNWRLHKPLLALLKRKVPAEMRRPSSSRRTSVIDVNFNVEGEREDEEEKEASAELDVEKVKRSRKKRRSKEESSPPSLPDHCREQENKDTCPQDASGAMTPDTLTSGATTPEPLEPQSYYIAPRDSQDNEELTVKVEQLEDRESDAFGGEEVNDDGSDGPTEEEKRGSSEEEEERMEVDLDEGTKGEEEEEEEEDEEEMKHRLYRLVAQSRLTYFSSTDDELDKVGHSDAELEGAEEEEEEEEEKTEEREEKTDGLTYKLCQLEKEVRATQFSSTEDELDKAGVMDGSMEEEEEELAVKVCKLVHQVNATQFSSTEDELDKVGVLDEDQPAEKGEELAVKVCRLVSQVNAAQFSSTEDELDRVGRGEEEAMDEETLWKVQAEKAVQAAQLRDLSSLVGVSKFPSAEDQPDGGEDGEPGSESSTWEEVPRRGQERRESFGYLDVDMFDLQDEIEKRQKEESQDEKVTTESVMDSETEDGQDGSEVEEKEDHSEETGGEGTEETEGRREVEAEEIIIFSQTKAQQENEPEAKRPEREEEEEELTESQESEEKWAPQADSQDEDDVEFNRIISSMLMMTLEDMQGEMLKNQEAENGRKNTESVGTETESRQEENNGDSQSTSASERTGSANEFQSPSEKVMLVTDAPGEEVTELDGNVSNENEGGGDSSGGGNELHELRNLANENPPEPPADQTTEAEQTSEGAEEEERGVLTEQQLTEPQGDAAEGDAAEGDAEEADNVEPWDTPHLQQGLMSPEQIHIRYSAASLRNITTEVLKVLNATEELLQGVEGGEDPPLPVSLLPPNTDPKKLDQQFSRLEENVYVAAGTVYSLEAELGDLEECARGISSATSDMELSYLEEQVASAAAKVQQSELQISDISARIAALKNAGLDVDSQSHMKTRTIPVRPVTLDSSRQLRRRLPAPPVKEDQQS